ncbi:MAG: hypothetical protein HN509_07820 [Halobacteriovoraceae bacterium]|nr:hypothetical protein [Halobacteriovoraceae bacterium]
MHAIIVLNSSSCTKTPPNYLIKEADFSTVHSISFYDHFLKNNFNSENGSLSHIKLNYQLEKKLVADWYRALSKIVIVKNKSGGKAAGVKPDFLSIFLKKRTLHIVGYRMEKLSLVIYRDNYLGNKTSVGNSAVSPKSFYLKNSDFDLLFQSSNSFRKKKFDFSQLEKAEYWQDGETYPLIGKTLTEIVKILETFRVSKYLYSGSVGRHKIKKFKIGVPINNTTKGHFNFYFKNRKLRLHFGKPIAHDPVLNVWEEGRPEIFQGSLPQWFLVKRATVNLIQERLKSKGSK